MCCARRPGGVRNWNDSACVSTLQPGGDPVFRPALTVMVLLTCAPAFAGDWEAKASWTTDYKGALKRAKQSKKVVFAFFTKPG